MPDTNAKIQLLTKNQAWHTSNATLVLEAGRVIFLSGVAPMISKVGDGATELQNLKWRETGVLLTSLTVPTLPDGATCLSTSILATDSMLEAMQKIQAQLNFIKNNYQGNF